MSHLHSKPLSFLLILSLCLLLLHSAFGVDPINLDRVLPPDCSGKARTNGSAFQTNLNTLFSSLNSKSPTSNFYNDTAGTGSDRVYGLFLCQGDLSHTDCQACINAATTDILKECSRRQAIIYYDYCQLRYSDRDFFGIMDPNGHSTHHPLSVSNPERPLEFVSNLLKEAPHNKPLMFASNASVEHHLFAMAECTMDITSADCAKCLNTIFEGIESCCSGYRGWRFLSPSCSIRYESVSFLQNPNFASNEIVESICSDDELSSDDGNSQQIVHRLLDSLKDQARTSGGFSNTSAGVDADWLYGLALCRADLDPESETCLNCLKVAADDAVYDCPKKTQAIVWKEKCLLRYSNQNFFGAISSDTDVLCGLAQISEEEDAAVIQMMTSLVDKAPENPRMFAAGTVGNGTGGYGLVQCTRDLSKEGCKDCLREAMGTATARCKQKNDGWRFLSGSCTARYESSEFFDTSILAADAPNVDSLPPVKSWGSACGPNFMIVALLCLLVINSIDGTGKW